MPARRSDEARRVDAHIGARLREIRELRGLSQGELAGRLGFASRQAVAAYEAGDAISVAVLLKLTDVLQVDLRHFYDGLGARPQLAEAGPAAASPQAAKIAALLARTPAAHHPAILAVVRAFLQAIEGAEERPAPRPDPPG